MQEPDTKTNEPMKDTNNKQSQATSQTLPCPRCGKLPANCTCESKAVKAITVKSLVTNEALTRVGRTEGFRFCFEPDCDIVYYHPQTGDRYLRADMRVRVGQKETTTPRPVCYCFNHTVEQIVADVAETGTSRIPDEIAQKCRQGLDRCEQTNPQGSCCLGNVRNAIKEAQAKFGKVPAGVADAGGLDTDTVDDCCAAATASSKVHTERLRNLGHWATAGAVVSAILSSACCWLPLLLIAFGASAVGVSGFFEAHRFGFLTATGVLLAVAYYLVYFRKTKCAPGSACDTPNRSFTRFNKIMLTVATVVVVLFAAFPNYVGVLVGGGDNAAATVAVGGSHLFQIDGMTCKGCAAKLQSRLAKVPGALRAEVFYESKTASVFFDSAVAAPKDHEIQQAIEEAGFRGALLQVEPTGPTEAELPDR